MPLRTYTMRIQSSDSEKLEDATVTTSTPNITGINNPPSEFDDVLLIPLALAIKEDLLFAESPRKSAYLETTSPVIFPFISSSRLLDMKYPF